jgi:uncharacterized protein YggE
MRQLLILAVLFSLFVSESVSAGNPGVIEARGMGVAEVQPDGVTIRFLIESKSDSSEGAQEQTTKKYANLVKDLVAFGFEEEGIRTAEYRVEKRQDIYRVAGEPPLVHYFAKHGVEVSLDDFSRISATVNMAMKAGVTYVTRITFTSTQEGDKKIEALRIAADEAIANAKVLAEAAGGRLGNLIEMKSEHIARAVPASAGGGQLTSVPVTIYPKPLQYQIRVWAEWEFEE